MKRVAVIGGGLAGLAAAIELAGNGLAVTVFEKRPFCGGRTFSFRKDFWPFAIDNGPHVLLGSYSATRSLLDKIGSLPLLQPQIRLEIPYRLPQGERAWLRAVRAPAPFHLLIGLLRFPLLGFKDLLPLVRAVWQLKRITDEDALDAVSVAAWLKKTAQTEAAGMLFWRPLTLATLNAPPEQVSLLQLARVLKLGFLRGRKESRLLLMPEGLSATLIDPAVSWLNRRHAELRFREPIRKIVAARNQPVQVFTADGRMLEFPAAVAALPVAEFCRSFFPIDE